MKQNRFGAVAAGLAVGLFVALAGASHTAAELPKGLVLYFNFDQAETGGVITDQSGLHNNGHAFGAKWTEKGKQGGAYEFAPVNSYIQVPNMPSLGVKQATFAAWIKTSRNDTIWRRILDKRADRGFALCVAGKLSVGVNGRFWCTSDNAIADGAWHHAAATFDGANLKLYVDGQLQKQVVPLRGEIVVNDNPLTIGMNGSNPSLQERGQSFDGAIDEVMIFNRALSADEVKGLLEGKSGGAGAKPKFTQVQVERRLRELKDLLDNGLITRDFYEQKVAECQTSQ